MTTVWPCDRHILKHGGESTFGVEPWSGVVFWSGFWSREFGLNLADTDVLPLEIIGHVKDDHLKSAYVFKQ